VTTWVENPRGGRERGPRGLARAWVEVLVRPRRFFRNGVAPGDQAPGLVFAACVALGYASLRFALAPGGIPALGGGGALSVVLVLAAVGLFVAPAALHLLAALQTLLLVAFVPDRGGVSETVQVVAYAAAPCLLSGIPSPGLRVVCALYGATLLALGVSEVHDASPVRAAAVTAPTSFLLFGLGFHGVSAATTLGRRAVAWLAAAGVV
jgi:hypothetical protein